MAGVIYSLCALTAFLCTYLLLRAYKSNGYKLLLWGGLCFIGITASNILLIVDKIFLPTIDLSPLRHSVTLASMMVFLYGLIWDIE